MHTGPESEGHDGWQHLSNGHSLAVASQARFSDRGLPSWMANLQDIRTQDAPSGVPLDLAHAARVSMLGELAASVAHEINQPLTGITICGQTALRLLRRCSPDLDQVRKLTERVVADAQRAADIAARVREMAAGRLPEQTVLSLDDDIIRQSLQFLDHMIKLRSVSVVHHLSPTSRHVLGDRVQLQQVIVNLAINSIQAMARTRKKEREIVIRTIAPDSTMLQCSVEDSGPGLKAEHFERVFESFFTTKQDGMGMGLHICRSIINAHGGRITADNDSLAGGARFTITLPAASTMHSVGLGAGLPSLADQRPFFHRRANRI